MQKANPDQKTQKGSEEIGVIELGEASNQRTSVIIQQRDPIYTMDISTALSPEKEGTKKKKKPKKKSPETPASSSTLAPVSAPTSNLQPLLKEVESTKPIAEPLSSGTQYQIPSTVLNSMAGDKLFDCINETIALCDDIKNGRREPCPVRLTYRDIPSEQEHELALSILQYPQSLLRYFIADFSEDYNGTIHATELFRDALFTLLSYPNNHIDEYEAWLKNYGNILKLWKTKGSNLKDRIDGMGGIGLTTFDLLFHIAYAPEIIDLFINILPGTNKPEDPKLNNLLLGFRKLNIKNSFNFYIIDRDNFQALEKKAKAQKIEGIDVLLPESLQIYIDQMRKLAHTLSWYEASKFFDEENIAIISEMKEKIKEIVEELIHEAEGFQEKYYHIDERTLSKTKRIGILKSLEAAGSDTTDIINLVELLESPESISPRWKNFFIKAGEFLENGTKVKVAQSGFLPTHLLTPPGMHLPSKKPLSKRKANPQKVYQKESSKPENTEEDNKKKTDERPTSDFKLEEEQDSLARLADARLARVGFSSSPNPSPIPVQPPKVVMVFPVTEASNTPSNVKFKNTPPVKKRHEPLRKRNIIVDYKQGVIRPVISRIPYGTVAWSDIMKDQCNSAAPIPTTQSEETSESEEPAQSFLEMSEHNTFSEVGYQAPVEQRELLNNLAEGILNNFQYQSSFIYKQNGQVFYEGYSFFFHHATFGPVLETKDARAIIHVIKHFQARYIDIYSGEIEMIELYCTHEYQEVEASIIHAFYHCYFLGEFPVIFSEQLPILQSSIPKFSMDTEESQLPSNTTEGILNQLLNSNSNTRISSQDLYDLIKASFTPIGTKKRFLEYEKVINLLQEKKTWTTRLDIKPITVVIILSILGKAEHKDYVHFVHHLLVFACYFLDQKKMVFELENLSSIWNSLSHLWIAEREHIKILPSLIKATCLLLESDTLTQSASDLAKIWYAIPKLPLNPRQRNKILEILITITQKKLGAENQDFNDSSLGMIWYAVSKLFSFTNNIDNLLKVLIEFTRKLLDSRDVNLSICNLANIFFSLSKLPLNDRFNSDELLKILIKRTCYVLDSHPTIGTNQDFSYIWLALFKLNIHQEILCQLLPGLILKSKNNNLVNMQKYFLEIFHGSVVLKMSFSTEMPQFVLDQYDNFLNWLWKNLHANHLKESLKIEIADLWITLKLLEHQLVAFPAIKIPAENDKMRDLINRSSVFHLLSKRENFLKANVKLILAGYFRNNLKTIEYNVLPGNNNPTIYEFDILFSCNGKRYVIEIDDRESLYPKDQVYNKLRDIILEKEGFLVIYIPLNNSSPNVIATEIIGIIQKIEADKIIVAPETSLKWNPPKT